MNFHSVFKFGDGITERKAPAQARKRTSKTARRIKTFQVSSLHFFKLALKYHAEVSVEDIRLLLFVLALLKYWMSTQSIYIYKYIITLGFL